MPPRGPLGWSFLLAVLFAAAVSLAVAQDNAAVHVERGVALAAKGDIDAAIAEFHEALRSRPNSPVAHCYLGLALGTKGDLEGAIAEFREALRLEPNYPVAHYNLGLALDKSGDLNGAIAEYREALRLRPDYPEAHNNLGVALQARGNDEEAAREFAKAKSEGGVADVVSSTPVAASNVATPQRVRLSQDVSEGNLITKVTPPYPSMARMAGVQGAVIVQVIISKEGTVQKLRVLSGPPMLVQAALDAVKQWRYRPYLLNGEPVEVETQVTVKFNLTGG